MQSAPASSARQVVRIWTLTAPPSARTVPLAPSVPRAPPRWSTVVPKAALTTTWIQLRHARHSVHVRSCAKLALRTPTATRPHHAASVLQVSIRQVGYTTSLPSVKRVSLADTHPQLHYQPSVATVQPARRTLTPIRGLHAKTVPLVPLQQTRHKRSCHTERQNASRVHLAR
jgi:hypothetical protein